MGSSQMDSGRFGWIEGTGDTVDEAIANALDQAGLSRDDAEIEIVSKPLVGRLFGAKARARVRPREGLPSEAAAVPAARVVEQFLQGVVDAMGLDAHVSVIVDGDTVDARVDGEDVGILIGRRGETLAAIMELARTVVARRIRSKVGVNLDIGGYRQKRREALADFARRQAERALSEGVAVTLRPMNAAERKIVHDAAKEVGGVRTYSEGREPDRSVVIAPVGPEEGAGSRGGSDNTTAV